MLVRDTLLRLARTCLYHLLLLFFNLGSKIDTTGCHDRSLLRRRGLHSVVNTLLLVRLRRLLLRVDGASRAARSLVSSGCYLLFVIIDGV